MFLITPVVRKIIPSSVKLTHPVHESTCKLVQREPIGFIAASVSNPQSPNLKLFKFSFIEIQSSRIASSTTRVHPVRSTWVRRLLTIVTCESFVIPGAKNHLARMFTHLSTSRVRILFPEQTKPSSVSGLAMFSRGGGVWSKIATPSSVTPGQVDTSRSLKFGHLLAKTYSALSVTPVFRNSKDSKLDPQQVATTATPVLISSTPLRAFQLLRSRCFSFKCLPPDSRFIFVTQDTIPLESSIAQPSAFITFNSGCVFPITSIKL
mmetsp:Transcript_35928/g.57365  ORF Transcript_35928/g.57365 Transcript_35928/m.57365 type:complete len:264 (+) Transcript_35928:5626-6417(+)